MLKSKKILVPYDYSKEAKQALAFSIKIAKVFKADVEVIHIGEDVNKESARRSEDQARSANVP